MTELQVKGEEDLQQGAEWKGKRKTSALGCFVVFFS